MTGSALKVNLAKVSITLLPSNNRYENGTEKIRFMGKFTNLIQGLLSRGSWGRGVWQGVMSPCMAWQGVMSREACAPPIFLKF